MVAAAVVVEVSLPTGKLLCVMYCVYVVCCLVYTSNHMFTIFLYYTNLQW